MGASVGLVIFAASVATAFAFWVLSVAEAVGVWRFWPWAFRSGLKVVEQELPRPAGSLMTAGNLNSRDVRAAVVHQTQIFFRAPMPVFQFRIHTPLPIHGAATLEGQGLHVIGRIPLGPIGFFGAWIIGWTVGGFMVAREPLSGFDIAAVGWLFAGAMIAFSLPLERRRFRRALDALVMQLSAPEAGDSNHVERQSVTANDLPEIPIRSPQGKK